MRQPGKAALTFGPTLGRIGWKEPHAYLGEGSGGSSLGQKWADCARAVVGLEESEQGQTSQAGVREMPVAHGGGPCKGSGVWSWMRACEMGSEFLPDLVWVRCGLLSVRGCSLSSLWSTSAHWPCCYWWPDASLPGQLRACAECRCELALHVFW